MTTTEILTTIPGPAGAFLVHSSHGRVTATAITAAGRRWVARCERAVLTMAPASLRGDAGRWVAVWSSGAPTAEQVVQAVTL